MSNTEEISAADSLSKAKVKIGVAAMLSPKYALPAYEEIVVYIGEKSGMKTEMQFTRDYVTMNNMVKKKEVLAAFVCSGPYVRGHDEWGMELIAAPSLHGKTVYYSYIIVNKNSNIKNFGELEGKSFAFTDPESNTGKLVPTYELSKTGKSPDEFFSRIIYTRSHDKSIEAVAAGLIEGAAVDNLIWEYMDNSDPVFTSKTKIIARLGPFCIPPFVTHPDCNKETKEKIKKILLSMHKDPKGKIILNKLFIDRFVVVDDDCYQSIREMNKWIKEMNDTLSAR